MIQSYGWFAAAIFVAACGTAAGAEKGTAPEPNTQPQIEQLVAELDSPEFAVREEATRRLAARGAAGVDRLLEAAQSGSMEVRARAVSILQAIYAGPQSDEKAVGAAERALEQLAGSKDVSVAGWAGAALARHNHIREERALAQVRKLGGIVKYVDPHNPAGFAINPPEEGSGGKDIHIVLGKKWKGGDEGLKHLERLTSLRRLYIAKNKRFSPVSAKAQEDLLRRLPNLDLQERGLACIGVAGHNNALPNGCYVQNLEPGGAAHKAGIRPTDVITGFSGKSVDDFQALIELIAERDPGEKVPVEVYRGGRTLTLEVELGEWSK